jgi:hypothetical protein
MIRRDRKSCSRQCGYQLARAARQAASPSYAVWHKRINKARGPASDYPCADCGEPAEDWSRSIHPAATSGSDSSPGAANATATTTARSARVIPGPR